MEAVPGRCLHPRMRARFKLFPPKVQTRALLGKPNGGHGDVSQVGFLASREVAGNVECR